MDQTMTDAPLTDAQKAARLFAIKARKGVMPLLPEVPLSREQTKKYRRDFLLAGVMRQFANAAPAQRKANKAGMKKQIKSLRRQLKRKGDHP